MMKTKVVCTALLLGLLVAGPAAASIVVSIQPAAQTVNISDGLTTADIVADIPQADAIVGWGLDLTLTGTSVSQLGLPAINEVDFDAAFATDGDALAALVPLGSIWGNGIVLATITFSIDSLGLTTLTLSDDNPADLSEGFALDPPPSGVFATVTYNPGSINVVPEPTTFALLAFGGLALLRRRR